MAKDRVPKKQELEDLSFMLDSPFEEEAINEMLNNMIEASRHQMEAAVALTKLIFEKKSADMINEEKVLATYKQALKTVSENLPLNKLWEKLN